MKAILFDHDDTLVATIQAKWAHHKYLAKTFYGKELSDEEIRPHWGKPLSLLIQLLYGTDDVNTAMAHNVATRKDFPKRLFEDTLPTLSFLRHIGKKIGLVTATTRSSLDHDLDTLKIPKSLFDHIQTEEDTLFHKPDSRVFEPALRWLTEEGISSQDVLYVGDTYNDMKAALGAGFHFIGVGTGLIEAREFSAHHVPGIERLSELRDILR